MVLADGLGPTPLNSVFYGRGQTTAVTRSDARFDALVSSPIGWEITAATYIAAGNYLYQVDRLGPGESSLSAGSNWPVMLLYATAAENLLKAIRIAQGEPAKVGAKLAEYFTKHALVAYAADAGLVLNKGERSLLTKLQHVLEAGSYPVAKKPGGSGKAWTWSNPKDVEATWRLLQLFDNALRATGTTCLASFEVDKLKYAHA